MLNQDCTVFTGILRVAGASWRMISMNKCQSHSLFCFSSLWTQVQKSKIRCKWCKIEVLGDNIDLNTFIWAFYSVVSFRCALPVAFGQLEAPAIDRGLDIYFLGSSLLGQDLALTATGRGFPWNE